MNSCVFLKAIAIFIASLALAACSGTNLGDGVSIAAGGDGPINDNPNQPPADTTAPIMSGNISDANDSAISAASTAAWTAATEDVAVAYYEVAVATDAGNGSCDVSDLNSPVIAWSKVPSGTDFSGAGFQLANGNLDGDNNPLSVQLNGDTNYCTGVRATDTSGNVSNIIVSTSPWSFLYLSCLEALNNEPTLPDGVYNLDPDGVAGEPSFAAFCDMTTQGGGWTLVMRYDAAEADASNFFMPLGSARSQINIADIQSLNNTGNVTASANFIPFIQNGSTTLMHVGKPSDGATDSSTYARVYFSDIYQVVLDNPSNIFDPTLDSVDNAGLIGTSVNGTSAVRKDQWYEADMTVMTAWDSDGSSTNSYRIDGGEGDGMWTNGNREGAVYSSGNTSNCEGHGNPKVQWGFTGNGGDQQTYGGNIQIGTHCRNNFQCAPENDINMMFIR